MNEPPPIGCALTIVDPGPVRQRRNDLYTARRHRNGELRVLRVFVERVEKAKIHVGDGSMRSMRHLVSVYWRAGARRTGEVFLHDEGTEWVRGHGPMARASLLATRKLVESK